MVREFQPGTDSMPTFETEEEKAWLPVFWEHTDDSVYKHMA